jgi:hypothetical protein
LHSVCNEQNDTMTTDRNMYRSSCLPAPEGPVWEDDVERLVVPVVPEEWQKYCSILPIVLVRAYNGPVDAIEHEVEIWHASEVAAEQLEDAPDGEEVLRLEGQRDALNVGAAAYHDETEVGRGVGVVDHRPG